MESTADPRRADHRIDAASTSAASESLKAAGDAIPEVSIEIFGYAVSWRAAATAVLTLATVMFFARLGARALWSSEFRWAEIAREMQLTSRYFWPTINGRVYFDKPLGSYWLVLAATGLTGGLTKHRRGCPARSPDCSAYGWSCSLGAASTTIAPRCSPDSSWPPVSASSFFHDTHRPTSRPSPENWRRSRFSCAMSNGRTDGGWSDYGW